MCAFQPTHLRFAYNTLFVFVLLWNKPRHMFAFAGILMDLVTCDTQTLLIIDGRNKLRETCTMPPQGLGLIIPWSTRTTILCRKERFRLLHAWLCSCSCERIFLLSSHNDKFKNLIHQCRHWALWGRTYASPLHSPVVKVWFPSSNQVICCIWGFPSKPYSSRSSVAFEMWMASLLT